MTDVSRAQQVTRVEALLATVSEVASTLSRSSGQLQAEIALLVTQLVAAMPSDLVDGVRRLRAQNEELKHELERSAVIEQAKGIVLTRSGCSADQAFGQLEELSRQRGRQLGELAADVVRSRGAVLDGEGGPHDPDNKAAPDEAAPDEARASRAAVGTVPWSGHDDQHAAL